jgi:hypothetical protein
MARQLVGLTARRLDGSVAQRSLVARWFDSSMVGGMTAQQLDGLTVGNQRLMA